MRANAGLSVALILLATGATRADGQAPPGYAECRVPLTDRVPFALASGDPMRNFAGDVNGDFNGDGVPDVALVDTKGDDVLVLLTNPIGLNQNLCPAPPTPVAVSLDTRGATALAAGDLRDDATWDLAVAESGGAAFLTNMGMAMFGRNFPTGLGENATPRAIAMADFDQDGVVDVAVGTRIVRTGEPVSGSIRVLYTQRASGAVTQVVVDEEVPIDALAIGDFDADDRLDIAALSAETARVRVALNAPSGRSFASVFDADLGAALESPVALAVGNFNLAAGDDLAVVNGPGVPLILPTPTNTPPATPTSTPVTPGAPTVTSTPVDTPTGDVPTEPPLSTATPTPTPTPTPTSTATRRTEFDPGNVVVFLSQPASGLVNFQLTATLAAGPGPAGIVAADFDQDGTPDLAISSIGDNRVIFYYGRRDGTFTAADPCANDACTGSGGKLAGCCVGLGPRALIPVPFFNKLRPDLVVGNAEDNSLSLLLGSMPSPTLTITATPTGTLGSHTPTPSETPTPSITRTGTRTEKPTPLPTTTCPPTGICVQGEGCASIQPYTDGGLSMLPVLGVIALALARRRRRSTVS